MVFKGAKAKSESALFKFEKAVAKYLVPKVPKIFDTKVLTLMTVLWGALVVYFYYLAKADTKWLWWVSIFIFVQWLTDLLDGGVGRYRKQGLVKWGFYMDHLLDYYFLCCVIFGLFLYLGMGIHLFLALIIFGMFFISTFLKFGALSEFDTSFVGLSPAEMRLLVVGTNLILMYLSRTFFNTIFFWFLILTGLLLLHNIDKTQKLMKKEDMKVKRKKR